MQRSYLARFAACILLLAMPLVAHAEFPPECDGLKEFDRAGLEEQRSRLTNEIAKDLERSGPNVPAAALRAKQERLLEVLFKLDCIRPDATLDPLSTRAADSARNALIPVFFATNRARAAGEGNVLKFNGDRVEEVTWGRAVISVPSKRDPGELNLPKLWKFELQPDVSKHFVLTEVKSLESSANFSGALRTELGNTSSKSLLIFVHGYRVTFDEAAMRTAQLAHDLNFGGVPMFFSWPSLGSLAGYWHDEEAVQLSEKGYDELLQVVGDLPFTSIYVLAHSMGNRLVTTVHNDRSKAGKNIRAMKEVLLAAPDISAEIFNQKIAPAFAAAGQPRTTIYASSGDVALMASKVVHSFRRLGDATPPIYRRVPFETVDASDAAPMRKGAGHSYVFDSPKVITDMQRLLFLGQAADTRLTLQPADGESPVYWKLK